MKKIILLVVLLYASSCAVQYNEAYYMADFRPYTEEGFIISPLSSYAASYKPLATICIEFTPGYDRTYVNEKIVESKVNDDMYLSANGKKQQWRCPTQDEMLKKLVDYAKSIGANGLLDYRFEAVRPVKSNFNQVLYYRLTAFAISI